MHPVSLRHTWSHKSGGQDRHALRNEIPTKDSSFRRTSKGLGLEASLHKTTKRAGFIWQRNSLLYEGVGSVLPFFVTPSFRCCDCSNPFLPSVPEAAVIVVIWPFFASSSLFVLQQLRETRELEQAVETTLPWEREPRRPPRCPFLCVKEALRPC